MKEEGLGRGGGGKGKGEENAGLKIVGMKKGNYVNSKTSGIMLVCC